MLLNISELYANWHMKDCTGLVVVNGRCLCVCVCVCVMKLCDVLKVRNTLVQSAYCVTMHRLNLANNIGWGRIDCEH
jgi:hypothetical protein